MKPASGNLCSSSLIPGSRASQVTSTSIGGGLACCRKASRQPSRCRVSDCSDVSLTTVTTTVSAGSVAIKLLHLHQGASRTKCIAHPLSKHVACHRRDEQGQAQEKLVRVTL